MDLLILGASARAASASAIRAGLRPVAADLFADRDLVALAPTAHRVEPGDYPDGLVRFANALPPTAWLFTGALENRPDLVDAVSLRHRLLGNPGSTLRSVRDPTRWTEALHAQGLAAPPVRLDPSGVPTNGGWLRKPIASAAGRGIEPWRGVGPLPPRTFLQKRVAGRSLSALFVGQEGTDASLVGITQQFLGRGTGSNPRDRFTYRGSLAPAVVSDRLAAEAQTIGRVLAREFGLRGLFGVDFIAGDDGRAWAVEVNPRYTASVEAVEWATGRPLLRDHLRACGVDPPNPARPIQPPGPFVARAIVRAARPSSWPEVEVPIDPHRFPRWADLPAPGTRFGPGDPVLTVFAAGSTPAGCRRALAGRLVEARRRLIPSD